MMRILALAAAGWACISTSPLTAGDKLKVGDKSPEFTLPSATRDSINFPGVSLKNEIGKNNIVLAFYPADWSGGCTKEMCTMRDNFAALGSLGATVYGVSGDYVFSHKEWANHLGIPFTLLSDHNHEVARAYDSYNAVRGMNLRTIYVIDRRGVIAYIDPSFNVSTAESFDNLTSALKKLP